MLVCHCCSHAISACYTDHSNSRNYFPSPAAAGNYTLAYDSAWGWVDANCGTKMPFLCKMVALMPGGSAPEPPLYVSKYSGYTYLLNTTAVTQVQAERSCNMQGAHLASYMALEEQVGRSSAGAG